MKSALRASLPLCLGVMLSATAWGEEAVQTDWSAGPDEPGPVTAWNARFELAREIDWGAQPGQLFLGPAMPITHVATNTFNEPAGVEAADLDGDGDNDIVCTAFAGDEVAWFENDGLGGGWTQHAIVDSFPGATALCCFDFDGDDDIDVAAAAESGHTVSWFENDGSGGGWIEHVVDAAITGPFSVCTDDLDGDGDNDLCTAAYYGSEVVWWENADGAGSSWVRHSVAPDFPGAWWARTADLDDDTDIDIVACSYGQRDVCWWENSGDGSSWTKHFIDDSFPNPTSLVIEDMDGDDDLDVVGDSYITTGGSLVWWENDGSGGGWTEHLVANALRGPFSVRTGDFDDDGDADVLSNERTVNRVHWYENVNGLGTLWIQHLIDDTSLGPNDVQAADIDGDLVVDPIATHAFEHAILWYELVDDYAASGRLKSSILSTGDPSTQWGTITWSCVEPAGTSVRVEVRASNDPGDLGTWAQVASSGEDLSGYISDDTQYLQYKVWLETTDDSATPTFSDITVAWQPATGAKEFGSLQRWFLSETPQPNPSAGDAATVRFALAHSCRIELSLYDVTGRKIATLAEGTYPEGEHVATIRGLPAGAYFYRMKAPEFQHTGKMIVSRP